MRWIAHSLIVLLAWCSGFGLGLAQAQDTGLHPIPALTARVLDETGTLDATQRQNLETRLAQLEAVRGSQMVILMVSSTQGEDIAAFAQRVGDSWKIGRKHIGDGLLLVIARQDRRVRIEVAKALEGAIPDLAASRIIEQTLKPAFQRNDFGGGLTQAIEQLDQLIAQEHLPAGQAGHAESAPSNRVNQIMAKSSDTSVEDLLSYLAVAATIGFVVVVAVMSMLAKWLGDGMAMVATHMLFGGIAWGVTGSWVAGLVAMAVVAGLLIWGFVFAGSTFGGGGGSHSSGGGFSSGGGGNFGGGGASGRW